MDAESFARIIGALKRQVPFRPFTLELRSRAKLPVDTPEALTIEEGLVTCHTNAGMWMFDSTSVVCVIIDPPRHDCSSVDYMIEEFVCEAVPVPDAIVNRERTKDAIQNDDELKGTLSRIMRFQMQAARLRRTEPNPANYHLSAAGFLAEIDAMQWAVREYLDTHPGGKAAA